MRSVRVRVAASYVRVVVRPLTVILLVIVARPVTGSSDENVAVRFSVVVFVRPPGVTTTSLLIDGASTPQRGSGAAVRVTLVPSS